MSAEGRWLIQKQALNCVLKTAFPDHLIALHQVSTAEPAQQEPAHDRLQDRPAV